MLASLLLIGNRPTRPVNHNRGGHHGEV